jgi:diguanylate cyclase (GGDEF)-like protein
MLQVRRWLTAAWVLLCSAGVRASELPDTWEVQFRSVPVPQATVPAIAQDRAGFLWVATNRGLTRYDGYRLRPIEAEGSSAKERNLGWIRALAPSRDGRMWIGTEFQGLLAYDPGRDRVDPHGGPKLPIRSLVEDGAGDVWVGTMGEGLFHYRVAQQRFEPQALSWQGSEERRVLALLVAKDGSTWAAHWRGLSHRVDGHWQPVAAPGDKDSPVLALSQTEDGRIWLGTQDGRLGVIERGQLRWVRRDIGQPVQALAQAPDGRLWVGTKTGLLWVNPNTGEIEARLHHDARRTTGLAGNDISALLRDATGNMWVSGFGLGLQRHLHHPALAVRGPDLDPASPMAEPDVRAITTLASGDVLAATQRGELVRLDGRHELATLGRWPRERRSIVEGIAEAPDGSLWLAAGGRLEHRGADGHLLRDWPLDGARAEQLLLAPDGGVWLGMQDGLFHLVGPEAQALERIEIREGSPLHGGVHALALQPGSGELWIGGQRGLFRLRHGRAEPVPQAPQAALGSPAVLALLWARDGTLWLDTPVSGLHRLLGWDAEKRARFERISERHGLEGAFGTNLHEDARGRIWSPLYVYDPRLDRVDGFGDADGANYGSIWFFASTVLPDGSLLFGGSAGLLRVQPLAYEPQDPHPPLVFGSLRVNGQLHRPVSLAEGLSLEPGTRSFGVEFAALDYADPQRVRYQYRLLGLETEWTTVDATARNPSFGPLRPGRYTLEVRASALPGRWSPEPLRLPVELHPAWWQTGWALSAGAALALLTIWGWMRWRTRALRAHEAELKALVEVRTAELRELSLTDALTGLRNRHYLENRLDEDQRRCLRRFEGQADAARGPDADLVLMLLDVDHFKRVNDVHGHAAGDTVLVQLAQRLRAVFRETDTLVRWGGEEILVLVRDTDRREAAELAARVGAAVRARPFDVGDGVTLPVTVSIGFCAFPLDPAHPRDWDWQACLNLADSALYAAKDQGRDGYVGAVTSRGLAPLQMPASLDDWRRETRLDVRRSRND